MRIDDDFHEENHNNKRHMNAADAVDTDVADIRTS